MVDFEAYHRRINAMNYALTHDDGIAINYDEADLILVGGVAGGQDARPACTWRCITACARPTTR